MNKTFLTTLVILIAAVGAGFLLFSDTNKPATNDSQQPTEQDTTVPDSWQTHESSQIGVALQHPNEADIDTEAGRLKVQILGPEAEENTEVTDGFTFFARPLDIPEDGSLETLAQNQYEADSGEPGVGIVAPQATTTADRAAFVYSTESAMGNAVTHQLIQVNAGKAIEVSYTIAAPAGTERDYESTINTMIRTLQLHQSDGDQSATSETVQIALLDYKDTGPESNGKERGCDRVVMVERDIAATQTPLTTVLEELFSLSSEEVDGWNNFIAKTNDTLSFDRAEVDNGTASIYLSGQLSGVAGVCDNPRAQIQIEETALQFATVDDVQLYLNGQETDLTPSARE